MKFVSVAIMAWWGVAGPLGWASMDRAADAPTLYGSAWVLSSLPGHTLVAGATPSARFEDGRVSGSDGCNRYTMPYTEYGEAIQMGPQGPSTMMACAEDTMAQARVFLDALLSARGFRRGGESLDLLDENGADVATLVTQARSLAGTTWKVIHINTGQALVGIVSGSALNISFHEEGKASGTAGCNRYAAAYSAQGHSLRFSRVVSTRMACPDRAVMEQETAFLQAMERVVALRFEGERLDLLQEDGSMALVLSRTSCGMVMD